jgi:hypothetical protein
MMELQTKFDDSNHSSLHTTESYDHGIERG